MSVLKLHRVFLATLMAFAVAISFAACSSDEEEAPPPEETSGVECERGDQGHCCDADPMQGGCAG